MSKLVLSNSQAQKWQHSPRCFWWRYIRDLALAEKPSYLTWGGAVHTALEHLYSGKGVEDTLTLMRENGDLQGLEELEMRGDHHTEGALRILLDEYAEQFEADLERFNILEVEFKDEFDLTSNLGWLGKFDLVLEEKETGDIYIMDHKTTSKKVTSSYYSERFSHDQQMTSYWWLGESAWEDRFNGIIINAFQTTKTIPARHGRFPISRDGWEIKEWHSNMLSMGPTIAQAKKQGKKFYEAGLKADDPEVINAFPICNTYAENFCDYKRLNRSAPALRERIIEQEYTTRRTRGGDTGG